MEVEVIESKENPLLQRREITAKITGFAATPSLKEVADALCKALPAKADVLSVAKIEHKTGRTTAVVTAKIYASPEAKKGAEREKKQKAKKEETK
ncbi:30S ribosomal protein S24e [Candidatus Micrarchaeota archaeon]|nr:30S ribosomal protein S24e [Candidatus Micrarchaeota archaeon]